MTAADERALEPVAALGATLGEGPVWDDDAGQLVWVDILGHAVHRTDPASGRTVSLDVGQEVGAVAPRAGGGLVLALREGIALLDPGASAPRLAAPVERDDRGTRMNDAKCDAAGRLWAGTMAFDARPGAGTLYRVERDLTVTPAISGVTVSNGLDWSPDGATMYYVDSATGGIDAFDFDVAAGALANRRRLVDVPRAEGMPDGLTVDAEGCLWVALWDGWAVRRYAPSGVLEQAIALPVARPTSCAFGGDDRRDLYVTSARKELDPRALAAQPLAGALLRLRPGAVGRPANRFAG